ncbi:MAG TPA: rhodanese-like domain-containing protein [Allocoleopsis sp.]
MTIISREKLIELLENKELGKDFILIDVRRPEELKQYGAIPKSINIPLDDFEETLEAAKKIKNFSRNISN